MFYAGSLLFVLPFWLLMIGLPGWRGTRYLLSSSLVLAPLPALYAILVVVFWRDLVALFANPTLPVLTDILGQPRGATICWVHLLAFDFFVGRWQYLDSQERGFSPLAMAPVMWATFLVGPFGLLLYLGLCAASGRPTDPKNGENQAISGQIRN